MVVWNYQMVLTNESTLIYCAVYVFAIASLFSDNDSNKLFAFTNSNSVKMTSSCSNKQVIHFVPKIFCTHTVNECVQKEFFKVYKGILN